MGIERRTRTTAVWIAAALTCGGAVAVANSSAADRGPEDSKPPADASPIKRSAAGTVAAARVTTAASAKVRATRRLSNKMITRFTQSGDSSYDQRLHLCRDKHFIYDEVFSGSPQRTEGRWRVTSARIRGRNWSARVRGVPEGGGGAVTIVIRVKRGRVTVNGNLAFAERSDLC